MKILIPDGLSDEGLAILQKAGHELTREFYEPEKLKEEIGNYDAIIVRSATKVRKEHIDAGTRLKAIARAGVGVDNIDVAYAKEKGIPVLNTPLASSISVAELAVAQMFALSRFLHVSTKEMQAGKWPKNEFSKGTELTGKTLGIIGFGPIGQQIAKRAAGLMMNVVAYNRSEKQTDLDVKFLSMDELLASSDFISLNIPFDKEKGATIGEAEFAAMKNGAILINCSRGGVVDEAALVGALKSGKLRAAAVDVFLNEPPTDAQAELISLPNVCLTPHIGASTVEAQDRVGTEIAEKVVETLSK